MIEIALFLAIMTFAVVAMIDYADIVNSKTQLSAAVRAGGTYAVANPTSPDLLPQVVKGATTLPPASINVTDSQFCECNAAAASCGSVCATPLATFTTISASYSVPTILPYPGIPQPFPVSETLTIRVQ